ncbi:hypothetical protein MXE68_11940, partial [Escherichia coli]|nr:hypothetical protein [Escherichia coli]
MKHSLFFTQDGYLLPSSVKPIYGKDGHYYAVITRECFECGGTGKIANAVCVTCNGSKTSPATEEKLVLKECIEFLETIPELRCNPDLEAWKRRHSEQLALLQADNSKFAASIAQQLNNNLFLTVRQLESFYSIDRNLNPQKTKKAPQNGCFFNTPCAPYERKRLLNRMTLIDSG